MFFQRIYTSVGVFSPLYVESSLRPTLASRGQVLQKVAKNSHGTAQTKEKYRKKNAESKILEEKERKESYF
jgi:hypothetical protein